MNYVFLAGIVTSMPTLITLPTSTKLSVFTMKVEETWLSREGERKKRYNYFKIEGLGQNADMIHKSIQPGNHINVVGYLRTDNNKLRVRVYSVSLNTKEGVLEGYGKAINQVLAILEDNDRMDQALQKIKLLKSGLQDDKIS